MPVRLRTIVRDHKNLLVALYEVGEMANASRQRAAHMVREDWFPREVECLRSGTHWWQFQVEDALAAKGFLRVPPTGMRPKEILSLVLPLVGPADLAELLQAV